MTRLVLTITRLAAGAALVGGAASISLTVSTSGGNATSPLMYGFMFEDINHSGDGGIHGQLLRNNGFQGAVHNLTAYAPVGNVGLSVDSDNPLTYAIPYSLAVAVPEGASGEVGFSNEGYWGIPVFADEYFATFFIKGDYAGSVTIRLINKFSGTEFGSAKVDVSSNGTDYGYYETRFQSKQAPDENTLWTLTFDAGSTAGSTLHFDLITLYPTTFHERVNGLKPQIANVLNDMGASFLRFPGGNNLEGSSENDRWRWNETLGALKYRPGREGAWNYTNTDALGLVEYFEWCEDMALEPILVVWSGFALGSGGNTPITDAGLTPYIDETLQELEFVLGDTSTPWGALRATLGHPAPFPLKFVEVGNEDNLGGGCATYGSRFTDYHAAISAAYPSLTIITSTADPNCLPSPLPTGVVLDYHNYGSSPELVANFSQFDHADRSAPLFIGEFSSYATQGNSRDEGESDADADSFRSLLPYVGGSVAEAVYMIGYERNADVVHMTAYAPLLQLYNATQWTPDLIGFTQNPNNGLARSTSYFVQQMFAQHWGTTTRAIEADANFGPVYWVATTNEGNGETYVKLANYGADMQSVSVNVAGSTSGSLIVLSGPEDAVNSLEVGEVVKPVTSTPAVNGDDTFALELPAWSVAVLVASGGGSSGAAGSATGTEGRRGTWGGWGEEGSRGARYQGASHDLAAVV